MKVLFFDVGYTLVNEDAVWETHCRDQAQTEEADYTISNLTELLKIFSYRKNLLSRVII